MSADAAPETFLDAMATNVETPLLGTVALGTGPTGGLAEVYGLHGPTALSGRFPFSFRMLYAEDPDPNVPGNAGQGEYGIRQQAAQWTLYTVKAYYVVGVIEGEGDMPALNALAVPWFERSRNAYLRRNNLALPGQIALVKGAKPGHASLATIPIGDTDCLAVQRDIWVTTVSNPPLSG